MGILSSDCPRTVLRFVYFFTSFPAFVTKRIPSSGFYIYLRRRGTETPFFQRGAIRPQLLYIIKKTAARDDQIRYGPEWVPQIKDEVQTERP